MYAAVIIRTAHNHYLTYVTYECMQLSSYLPHTTTTYVTYVHINVHMYVRTCHLCMTCKHHLTYTYTYVRMLHTITVFPPGIVSGMLNTYVGTYIHAYILHHIHIRIHTMHHKLLAASVLGTSMICTKHRFSIIYECIHVFPTNSIKF